MRQIGLLPGLALVGLASVCGANPPAADLIVRDARVWTGTHPAEEPTALAVLGERIVAVGPTTEVMAWRGPKTRAVAAHGARIVPGFNDAHTHFMTGGIGLASVPLNDATTPEEFQRRLADQTLTVEEALEAYTAGSAYAEFQERDKGTLEIGKLADVVILAADVLHIQPEDLRHAHVVATYVGGREVYHHP